MRVRCNGPADLLGMDYYYILYDLGIPTETGKALRLPLFKLSF
jgi:hypothetical protein